MALPFVLQKLAKNSMADKIALVTGSSSGIGLLTTIELAKDGFKVVASMRDLGRRSVWTKPPRPRA